MDISIYCKKYLNLIFLFPMFWLQANKEMSRQQKKGWSPISNMPVLSISDEAERFASLLIKDGPLPKEYPEDALHIAIAAVSGMDYLLTWNFTPINNAQMKAKIISAFETEGYHCPIICSPE